MQASEQERTLVKNAASKKQVRNASTKEKVSTQVQTNDLLWVLSDPRGRRVMSRIVGLGQVFTCGFEGSARVHFNEGLRFGAIEVLAWIIDADKKAYLKMLEEEGDQTNG